MGCGLAARSEMSPVGTPLRDGKKMARGQVNKFGLDFGGGLVKFGRKNDKDEYETVGTFRAGDLPVEVQAKLVLVGLRTMFNQAATRPDGDPVEDVTGLFNELSAGEWPENGRTGPRGTAKAFVLAFVQWAAENGRELSEENAKKALDSMDEGKKKAITSRADYQRILAKVRLDLANSRNSGKDEDAGDILDGLEF